MPKVIQIGSGYAALALFGLYVAAKQPSARLQPYGTTRRLLFLWALTIFAFHFRALLRAQVLLRRLCKRRGDD